MPTNFHWTFGSIIASAVLGGCGGAEDAGSNERALRCRTEWRGEMPSASALSLRTCLSDTICSDMVTGDRYGDLSDPELNPDCASQNGCGNTLGGFVPTPSLGSSELVEFRAHWWDTTDGQRSSGGPSFEFVLQLNYPPWVSDTLGESSRGTLWVQADSGEVLVDAESLEPYVTVIDPQSSPATCRGAWLNLDGSLRSEQYPSY